MPSPAGWREVPCAQCGAFVQGIDFGDRCRDCLALRLGRVNRIARRISLSATAATAGWVILSHAVEGLGPWYTMAAIAGTYGLVYAITKRVAMEVL